MICTTPDYHAAYEGLTPARSGVITQAVRQVLLLWKDGRYGQSSSRMRM